MIANDSVLSLRSMAHQLARERLFPFMRMAHPIVAPGVTFIPAAHLRVIAYHLELVARGEIKRLLIAVPPRHFKSFAASVSFPTWLLGINPYLKIFVGTYGTTLSDIFSNQSRLIMQSPTYLQLFPETRLQLGERGLDALVTTRRGYRRATSVQGAITGIGADVIIVDDPLKAGEAYSEAARNTAHDWVKTSLSGRFDRPATGAMIVVMQRLHQDDLIGRLIAEGGWTLLELPGEIEKEMTLKFDDHAAIQMSAGSILFPENFNDDALAQLKLDLGEAAYNAQILQRPAPPGGAMIKLKWFQRYDTLPADGFERIFQSWDTAVSDAGTADYSVCTTWGVRGIYLYLLDVFRERLPYHELLKIVPQLREKHEAEHVIVEHAGTGILLKQHIRNLAGHDWLWSIRPISGKQERVASQTPKIEGGRVFLPTKAPWLRTFEDEITQFPNGRFDDQVDAMSQFLQLLDSVRHHPMLNDLSMWAGH